MRDFWELFKKKIATAPSEALSLTERLEQTVDPGEFERYLEQEATMKLLLDIRAGISTMFAWRISGLCTEVRWERIHQSHAETIRIFDELAWENGFQITEKRACVSFVEMAREQGVIQVTSKGVSLTPIGEQIAEEVRREIEGE